MTRPSAARPSSVGCTLGLPPPVGHGEHVAQAVRSRLVRAEEPEVVPIRDDHVAQERSEHAGRFRHFDPRRLSLRRRSRGNRAARGRAGGVRRWRAGSRSFGAPPRGQSRRAPAQPALIVEELLRPIAAQPLLEHTKVIRVRRAHRSSVPDASARSLPSATRRSRAGPSSLWASAARSSARSAAPSRRRLACAPLDLARFDRAPRRAVAAKRACTSAWSSSAPIEMKRLVSIAAHQRLELVLRDAGEDGRVRDLVAVQVQDRQHCAVGTRVQELVGVPARRERAGLGLAVADDAGNQQVRIVEAAP